MASQLPVMGIIIHMVIVLARKFPCFKNDLLSCALMYYRQISNDSPPNVTFGKSEKAKFSSPAECGESVLRTIPNMEVSTAH